MICSSVNRDFRIVRQLICGLYPNLEEFQGLRSPSAASAWPPPAGRSRYLLPVAVAQHPTDRKRVFEMQRIDPVHDRQPRRGRRPRKVVDAAPAQPQQRRLLRERQGMDAVDHRFALSRPTLLSAPDKNSFSSASSPIFACRTVKSAIAATEVAPKS